MSLDINSTQNISISAFNENIKSRLDLLYLTFLIEEDLEKRIKKIIPSKKTKLEELLKLFINKEIADKFLKFNTEKYSGKVVGKRDDGDYFYVDNFISNTTFGGILKLLESMKDSCLSEVFDDLRKEVNWKTIKKWYGNIKDLRNILAHRSSINIDTLFSKLPEPATPKNNKIFMDLNRSKKSKSLLRFFLIKNMDDEVKRIFDKFDI